MIRIAVVVSLLVINVCRAETEEIAVKSRVESVGMFKNGLSVIKQIIQVPKPGLYRVENLPDPVHGTFWLESDAHVEAHVSIRQTESVLSAKQSMDLQENLAGCEVEIRFHDSAVPPAIGRVLALAPASGDDAWNRTYQNDYYSYFYRSSLPASSSSQPRFLILETKEGRVFVDQSMIAYAKVLNDQHKTYAAKPVLLLDVKSEKKGDLTVAVSYLAKGIGWVPSYRVDLSDKEQLTIEQEAVIKNELMDIHEAKVDLISGFPSIKFSQVTSPLSLRTTWATFFQQLSEREPISHPSLLNVASQQAVSYNEPPTATVDMSALMSGEGPDVRYQSVGEKSLAEGDSMVFSVASAKAEYERIVEWVVPDSSWGESRRRYGYGRDNDPEQRQGEVWEAVTFKNPLLFPMTTGAAMIVSAGKFQGQVMSTWVNPGERTTLHITKALSLRTHSTENEESIKREAVRVAGDDYQKATIKGKLDLGNLRTEPMKIIVRRRFTGALLEADEKPRTELLEEGVWTVNKLTELTWTIELKPGEQKELTYRYTVLVNP